jgi:DnaJ family protein C protein 13
VLSALLSQPTHGPRVSLLLHKLLPPGLVASIAEGPPEAVMRALSQVREGGDGGTSCLQAACARV